MWTGDGVRHLRYRLGWSQAEMARHLGLDIPTLSGLETGRSAFSDRISNDLVRISQQAESIADRVHRRPLAEVIMRDRQLCQIHDFDVVEGGEGNLDESTIKGRA